MKPCSKNRKDLALMAMGILDAPRKAALESHLKSCEPCRHYFNELSKVSENLRAVPMEESLKPSPGFHHRFASAIRRTDAKPSVAEVFARLWVSLRAWDGLARSLAAAAIILLGVALSSRFWHHRAVSVALAPTSAVVPADSAPRPELSPTLANYQRIANESLEQLDAVLTRQSAAASSPARVYTASNTRE